MILINRKKMNHKKTIVIKNTKVTVSTSYKYTGILIQDDLKWNEHVNSHAKAN